MATAGNFARKIVQTQKSADQTDCLLSLPAHIQESKKLIKRNGETVEIVTLTLTSSGGVGNPKLVQPQPEEQQVQQIVIEQAASTTISNVSSSLTDTSGHILGVGSKVEGNHGGSVSSTGADDDDSHHQVITTTTATGDANIDQQHVQNVIVDGSHQISTNTIPLGNNNNQVQPGASSEEFLMVTSTSVPNSNNGVTHSGVTFLAADPGANSSGILGIASYGTDNEAVGTSGMASQHMSLVQRVHPGRLTDSIIVATPSTNVEDYSFCLVCGDKGSGFHYSVFSCEGCKGFFKRSVQKNLTYTCKNDGNCDINRFSRNNCQYCRFKKCLQFGMKKEGVRDDRTPGGLTRARFKRLRTPDHDVPVTESKQSQYQLENDIQLLVNCDPYISPSFVSSEEKTATLYGAFQLTAILYDDLIYTVKWAKQVLGFRTLEMEDQKRLLEGVLIELSLFRLAYRSFASEDHKLRFAHDIELTLAESEQLGFDSDYINAIVTLIDRLRDLEIDDKEYAILCAIMLFYEDTVGLRDTITVLKMQQKYLTILQRYIRLVYGGDLRRYGRMLLRLPALRTIAVEIDDVFEQFIVSNRPPVQEMLDSALFDHVDTTEVESYDQMVITTVPDIQLEEHSVMEASVEPDTVEMTKTETVEHVSIESV